MPKPVTYRQDPLTTSDTAYRKALGNRLRLARTRAGFDTIGEAADRVGVPRATLNHYEIASGNAAAPRIDLLQRLARLYRVELSALLPGAPYNPQPMARQEAATVEAPEPGADVPEPPEPTLPAMLVPAWLLKRVESLESAAEEQRKRTDWLYRKLRELEQAADTDNPFA